MNLWIKLQEWNNFSACVRLLLAFLCGALLGLRPEYKRRPAGMRTHILVCIGSATAAMTGFYVYSAYGAVADPLRIAAQVISGIGFLGVGTIIIIGRGQVKGLTTAAGLWNCAAVGIALGAGFFLGGILCTLLGLFAITILETLEKRRMKKYKTVDVYMEIMDIQKVNSVVELLREPEYGVTNLQIKAARSELPNSIGVEATLTVENGRNKQELLNQIADMESIAFAIESE